MDASYALLVEAFASVPGGHLMDALEKTEMYRDGGRDPEEQEQIDVERQNEASLAQLENMMRRVG